MYNYPYGDNQQINLNWIISEIIALHQRLDPDYTAPAFTQIYPFSDTQQLNLDWILTELKALKDLAPTPPPTEEINEIGHALIAGAYDATTSYQKNDYIVQDGKLYRANAATTGTFNPTKWNEVMLGDDLAIITRWADATNTYLNNLAASDVANDSDLTGATVKDALNTLKNDVSGMTTDDVANESDVTGTTATAALNNLNGALTSLDNEKVARSPVYVSSLTELDNNITSKFFIASTDIAIGSTGVTIPAYSRCIFINSASADGALIAVTNSGSIISAFRNNGTWINARINTPDSPALTGTPTAPTAASGTNTTQIATTAFVAAAIQALTAKSVSHQATAGTNITTLELTAVKVSNVVNLYLVFIPTNNMAYTGDVVCSNMEYLPFNAMQIPAYCVSGSHLGQTTRLIMTMAGQIQTHYSDPTPLAGEAWFINTSYICD